MTASSLSIVAAMVSRSASFCGSLAVERGELGALLGDLVDRGTGAAWRPAPAAHPAGGLKLASGSSVGQRRLQPRDVELRARSDRFAVPALRVVHGRIELDQHVAGFDRLAVLDVDRAHHAGLERLDDLGAAGRNDLAGGRGDDVDLAEARPRQRDAEQRR